MKRLANWLLLKLQPTRPPDRVIGPVWSPYMRRWYLIPRNPFLNLYLHQICRSDDARALHDHPWCNLSWILSGWYWEVTPKDWYRRSAGQLVARTGGARHRLVIGRPCWSLFLTGPVYRRWGFWCPQGWRWHREYEQDGCE